MHVVGDADVPEKVEQIDDAIGVYDLHYLPNSGQVDCIKRDDGGEPTPCDGVDVSIVETILRGHGIDVDAVRLEDEEWTVLGARRVEIRL